MTIHLFDANLRGADVGVIVETEDGTPLGHWPVGMEEAIERVLDQWPDASYVVHEA